MKYIKTYENLTKLKKYFIYKSDDPEIVYNCVENVDESNFMLKVIIFDRNNEPHESVPINFLRAKQSMLDRIVYQSDDIKDIANTLKALKTTDKYNL